ncbi:MAG TPA: NADH-quinone oxidoreductase subunit N [Bdellovibrionota bacterium]|nr:NADH-quinone oxidoreductase subunit N [Bdellovibrionota bacterium]
MERTLQDLTFIVPELILVLTLCVLVILGLKFKNKFFFIGLVKFGIALAFLFFFYNNQASSLSDLFTWGSYLKKASLFSEGLSIDPLSQFIKILIFFGTLMCLWFGLNSYEVEEKDYLELSVLLLGSTIGLCFLASASDLLMIYLSVETVSLFSYVLAGFRKKHLLSNEAAVKYMLFGAFSSGTMLYGMSLLFGITGSLNLAEIATYVTSMEAQNFALTVSALLIFSGFAFKISAVPFHMWTPDVYEGSPTAITTFFSVAPKVAGFAVMIRFFYSTFALYLPEQGPAWAVLAQIPWPDIIALLSAITMTVGNLAALTQTNAKRLLAYSTIAHSGYMLMGFVVLHISGIEAILFYTIIYILMKLGAFFAVLLVGNYTKSEEIFAFKGLGWKSPVFAVTVTIFLFSLIGLPPTGGFVGKLLIFSAALKFNYLWLVIVAMINSVISLFYYAKILKAMFFEKPEKKEPFTLSFFDSSILVILGAGVMFVGLYWEPIYQWVKMSADFIIG